MYLPSIQREPLFAPDRRYGLLMLTVPEHSSSPKIPRSGDLARGWRGVSELGRVQMPECSMKFPAVQLNAGQSHALAVPGLKRV